MFYFIYLFVVFLFACGSPDTKTQQTAKPLTQFHTQAKEVVIWQKEDVKILKKCIRSKDVWNMRRLPLDEWMINECKKCLESISENILIKEYIVVKYVLFHDNFKYGGSLFKFSQVFTISDFYKIKEEDLDPTKDSTQVGFIKFKPGQWDNPIPGEVKFLNKIRFQYIMRDDADGYSLVIISKHINDNIKDNLKIKRPWYKIEKNFSLGGKGEIKKVTYNNRTFIIKQNKKNFREYLSKEILIYENLLDISGIGPYYGYLGSTIELGDINRKRIGMLMPLGEPIEDYLNRVNDKNKRDELIRPLLTTVSELHKKPIYHNNLKLGNVIIYQNKPYIIDFGNASNRSYQLDRGGGFTYPYYYEGVKTGIKADLEAMGFTLFAIRYYKDDYFKDEFIEKTDDNKNPTGEFYLRARLASRESFDKFIQKIENKPGRDKIDSIIVNLLKGKYNNAEEAIRDLL